FDLTAPALESNPVIRIHSDPSERVSCTETVYGEFFVGPILSRKEHIPLLKLGPFDEPPSEVPAALHLEGSSRDVPPDWLAWRLTSGDMFYARIAQETIAVRADNTDKNALLLPSNRITSMRQRPDKTFSFRTDTQTVVGRPDERSLSLVLLCDKSTCAVPFKLLDCTDAVPLTSLPPPVLPRPGLTPAQQGMVRLDGGPFIMGRTRGEGMHNELPPHEVTLSPFLMDSCEITVAQFREFVNDTGYKSDAEKEKLAQTWRSPGFTQQDDEPVVCVSWRDAARFCNWRSRKTRLQPCYKFKRRGAEIVSRPERNGFRLPTETEWEYAARSAGKDVIYPWGDETDPEKLVTLANFNPRAGSPRDLWEWTNPVKTFPANRSMLHGMAGNVWEWCQDCYYDKAYSAISRHRNMNPCIKFEDVAGLTMRVMRGGSFHNELDMLRCSSRGGGPPRASNTRVGFRCARNVEAGHQ
ncbi:MAG: formylglycine-generating enzyme family protein, partial [Lentisphaerales bacterium]